MVTLITCNSHSEADIIKGKLASFGVEAVIFSDDEGGLHPGMAMVNGVQIKVKEEDLEKAKEIISTN